MRCNMRLGCLDLPSHYASPWTLRKRCHRDRGYHLTNHFSYHPLNKHTKQEPQLIYNANIAVYSGMSICTWLMVKYCRSALVINWPNNHKKKPNKHFQLSSAINNISFRSRLTAAALGISYFIFHIFSYNFCIQYSCIMCTVGSNSCFTLIPSQKGILN